MLRVRGTRREPQMTAQMTAGTELLLRRRQFLRGIEGAAEATLDVLPVRLGVLIQPQLCPAHIQLRPASGSGGTGVSHRQHVGVDDLRGQKLCHGGGPFAVEVQVEGRFGPSCSIKQP